MAQRHLSRSIVMQALFEWDFDPSRRGSLVEIVERVAKEFAPGLKDISFCQELAKGILDKRVTLDEIIVKAAPDWPIDKIATLDRNILRLGLYELLFGDRAEVPPKVAINEAIELAKAFGADTSGKFVNGVLGAVYKELGEPGKNETSKKKDIDPATLPLDSLVGAVVYARDGQTIYLGLVHDVFGRWTLTKGHLKDNETEEAGVVRKAKEELGAEVTKIVKKLGQNEYIANIPETGKVRKRVSYYLAEAQFSPLAVGESGGLDDAKWFKLADIADLTMYDDIIPIMTKGIEILTLPIKK